MPVQVTHAAGIAILRVSGRLDPRGAAELERAALDAMLSAGALVLDVAEATDTSPAALRVLVMLDSIIAHRGQRLCICPSDSLLRRGLDVAELALRASYAPSVAAAEAALTATE
jgi:anti-anti-sigma regulatory factor